MLADSPVTEVVALGVLTAGAAGAGTGGDCTLSSSATCRSDHNNDDDYDMKKGHVDGDYDGNDGDVYEDEDDMSNKQH